MLVLNGPRGVVFRCDVPRGGRERRRGLIGVTRLGRDEALLIPNATSVHTFGMRFPILVVRLDDALAVVDVRRVRSWRFVPPLRRARHVLECHEEADVRVGDVLRPATRSADDGANEREQEHRDDGEGDDDGRGEPARPGGERYWLASRGVRLDESEELQQRPHR